MKKKKPLEKTSELVYCWNCQCGVREVDENGLCKKNCVKEIMPRNYTAQLSQLNAGQTPTYISELKI